MLCIYGNYIFIFLYQLDTANNPGVHGEKMNKSEYKNPSLARLFTSFLRLGATSFGGPAMVSYIRKMAVEQKHWLDEESFRYGVALCQTIPGATAMQTSAYVGLKVRGVAGALMSFAGFGLPAFIIIRTYAFECR